MPNQYNESWFSHDRGQWMKAILLDNSVGCGGYTIGREGRVHKRRV